MNSSTVPTLVFLTTAFPPEVSGSAHFNWARAQWFANQGKYRVIVFAPDGQKGVHKLDINSNLIVERYASKPWIPYKLTYVPTLQAARQISRQIADYQPDIIVTTDVERYFLLSAWHLPGRSYAKEHGIPYLAEYHTDVYNFSSTYPGWQWLRDVVLRFRLLSYLYHQVDTTICPSVAASNSCQEMGVNNTHVIPFFGTDISSYTPAKRDRTCLSPWLSPEERDNKVILFLGRLGFEKRVDLLIQAFAALKRDHPNYSLLIVGDGPEDVVQSLKRSAATVPDVHFTGFLMGEAKANILASCDLFCSPSPYETFGLTVVEAMASGIPVITVASGAVTDYLTDGVNAYLVPPNDVDQLAQCLNRAMTHDNSTLIQRALEQAKGYSVEHGCEQLEHYYQQLLNTQQPTQLSLVGSAHPTTIS